MIKANFNTYNTYVTDSLYQWDLNQVLSVNGLNLPTAPEVHFSNANMRNAIVRQATLKNNVVSVNIPNSLLQDPLPIYAYIGIYEGDTFKVIELVQIPVIAKKRPLDYQIEGSDEEIYSFKKLENEIVNAKNEIENECDSNLKALTTTVREARSDLETEVENVTKTLSAQVANIVAHNNDTDGNTELIDARVSANGKTYASLGEAIRTQIVNNGFCYISVRSTTPITIDLDSYQITIPSGCFAIFDKSTGTKVESGTYDLVGDIGCFLYYDIASHKIVSKLASQPTDTEMLIGSVTRDNQKAWLNSNHFEIKHGTPIEYAIISVVGKTKVKANLYNGKAEIVVPSATYYKYGANLAQLKAGTYTYEKSSLTAWVFINVETSELVLDVSNDAVENPKYVLVGIISNNTIYLTCNDYEFNDYKKANSVEHFTVSVRIGDTEHTDAGMIKLPSNYNANGDPTRLVIFCHGSGEHVNNSVNTLPNPFEHLVKLGYAVMDMNGLPSDVGGSNNGKHFNAPFAMQSYLKGYQYVIDHYNVKKEVFVTGMSLGGAIGFQLLQCGSIPVIAGGLFCPVTDMFKQAWCKPWATNQRYNIAKYFNFDGYENFTFTASGTPTDEEVAYFVENLNKIQGYNPISHFDIAYDSDFCVLNDENENEKYSKLRKVFPVPLKIWHNLNDGTISEIYSEYMKNSIVNCGGIAVLRTFETGGHNAWDNGDYISITDIDGNELTLKESGYELYKWFKEFEN